MIDHNRNNQFDDDQYRDFVRSCGTDPVLEEYGYSMGANRGALRHEPKAPNSQPAFPEGSAPHP